MQRRQKGKGKRNKRVRAAYRDSLPVVWAVTGCTCGHADHWGEIISQCWRCLIAGLPGAQETRKNRTEDRKLYTRLVRRHGKKSPLLRHGMHVQNIAQIVRSIERRLAR